MPRYDHSVNTLARDYISFEVFKLECNAQIGITDVDVNSNRTFRCRRQTGSHLQDYAESAARAQPGLLVAPPTTVG